MIGTWPVAPAIRTYRRWRGGNARFPRVRVVPELDDVPACPHPRHIYLIGTQDRPKWVAFDCSCGHGHRIEINVGSRSPWSVAIGPDGVTLGPSVDRNDGRRCHFWLRRSRACWC
jgi:hypothetical protein